MALLRYITHPNVSIDPEVAVTAWSLSSEGASRMQAMCDQSWVGSIEHIISSGETKAVEAASILADHLGLTIEIRATTGETDRSATGFVPHSRHEQLADRFFGAPTESADGWETAVAAQERIVASLSDVLSDPTRDTAVIGHGAVGTLLMCHLAHLSIDRVHDQPGQGHYFTWDHGEQRLLHRWLPIA